MQSFYHNFCSRMQSYLNHITYYNLDKQTPTKSIRMYLHIIIQI
jgi:hypothetical protein